MPGVLTGMKRMKIRAPMTSAREDEEYMIAKANGPAKVLLQTKCCLAFSVDQLAPTQKVTVQYLRNDTADYIKIFKHKSCVLHLDRRLLTFVQNTDRLELAFNAKQRDYEWWILRFDKYEMRSFYKLHYLVLEDATL